MSGSCSRAPILLACLVIFAGCAGHSALPTQQPNTLEKAHKKAFQSGGTTLTLTPNFNTGFGPISSLYKADEQPSPGPNATLDAGNIDFGTISPGIDYYYHYAMEIQITASSSYQLTGSVSGGIAPGISADQLTWLPSKATGYSDALGGISFGSANSPTVVMAGSSGTTTLKYDYILMVPNITASGASTAEIEYTVLP